MERFCSKLKQFRRMATRYGKLADNLPAMVKLERGDPDQEGA